jgi:hypothetical protein
MHIRHGDGIASECGHGAACDDGFDQAQSAMMRHLSADLKRGHMLTIGRDKADMTLVLVTVGGDAHKKLLVI